MIETATKIMNQGTQFHLAGLRCLDARQIGVGSVEWLPIAATVNLALAEELFAKAIITARGQATAKTHSVRELVDKLSGEDRDRVKAAYTVRSVDQSFDDALAFADDLFTRVRYFFESDEDAVVFARSLPDLADAFGVVAAACVADSS